MADIINVLPDNVANQIAAGEVIQRPASVIKELVENAVDAGATSVEVIVKNAGKTLIQVIDNGIGMSDTDARLCFERHATSKITCAEDLFKLHTKGFRGEALASIAAIAHVELKTKQSTHDIGTKVVMEGFKCVEQNPCPHPTGTSVAVKNLFFNVPARRNFLKSEKVEFGHIQEEFIRIALVNNEVEFKLYHDDKLEYNLPKTLRKTRIVNIFGKQIQEKLIPIEQKSEIVNIEGYIGMPEAARKTKGEQYLFVNDRFFKHAYFHHAISSAYDSLIGEKSFSPYFVFFDINPEAIDVNIHPTKTEIKFIDEQHIYSILHSTVKHSIGTFSLHTTIDFDNPSPIEINELSNGVRAPITCSNPDYNPFDVKKTSQNNNSNSNWNSKVSVQGWKNIYQSIEENTPEEAIETQQKLFEKEEGTLPVEEHKSAVFQTLGNYIVGKLKSGFIVIDRKAAMERILYERYLQQLENKSGATQKLLFPESLTFAPQNSETIGELLKDFGSLGFDIEPFGKNTFILNGVPADLGKMNPQEAIETLLESYKNNLISLKISKINNLAHSFARTVNGGQPQELTDEQMQNIISELFSCSNAQQAPSGKKICVFFNDKELLRLFM